MSADALREVSRLDAGERQDPGPAQSIFSVDSPEELVQFRMSEVERLRQDINTPVEQLVTALLQLGILLADYPDLGDAEPPFRQARELMDKDAAFLYSLQRVVFVQMWARVLQQKNEFEVADALYSAVLDDTRRSRGREHPWTLELQNNLGCLRTAAGTWYATQGLDEKANDCFNGADMLFKKSYKAKLHVFDLMHRATLKTKCNISIVSFLRGDASELESDLVNALQGLDKSYVSDDYSIKEVAAHLVSIYRRTGNFDRALDIIEEFGVDASEDYEIQPFKDTFIPRLPPRPKFVDSVYGFVDEEQLRVEILRNVLDIVGPSWGRLSVQILSWTNDKIQRWTGMNTFMFFEAMGYPDLADWSVITRRDVLLEQAAAVAHFEAVEILLQKLPKAPNISNEGVLVNAFHRAVESGNSDVIRLFLDHGVNLSATDDTGQSALHKAAELGLEDAFVELLARVENVDMKNSEGDTALDLALWRNHEQIIRAVMIKKNALIASSKSIMNTSAKKKLDESQMEVWDKTLYTGLDATIVDFYVDQAHELEEHRVHTKPVEAVVSDSDLLRSIVNTEDSDEKADFTWIHVPANNMFWVETLMKNLAEVSEDRVGYSNLMTKEVWKNQLHESLHGAFHGRFMKPFCGNISGGSSSNVVLYMPYIHWESNSMKKEMDEAIKKIQNMHRHRWKNLVKLLKKHTSSKKRDESRGVLELSHDDNMDEAKLGSDFRLLDTYLHFSDASPLHVRRTFDQFQYYMNDDTAARDADQVVSRYFERRHPGATVPIMMVDQLWMWIIDNRILVTCFPQRWGGGGILKEKKAIFNMRNVLHSILDRLKVKYREPLQTVHNLADLIMTRCLGLHSDNTQWQNERHRYLEIFEHSINYVTDEEIRRFNYFADGGRAGAKAKKRKPEKAQDEKKWSRRKRQVEELLESFRIESGESEVKTAADPTKRQWGIKEKDIEEIFDISDEIELLKEIKDIRDELNILRTLYGQQGRVLSSYYHASGGRVRPSEMADVVKRLTNIVEKMDVDAQRPYKALEDLLDLKQKQANVSEARIARVSGNTITVFTVVTIVFLPASFMAAFFALPVAEYPFVDELFPLAYAIKWTISVTAAIAVPLVILALYVNPIMRLVHLMSSIIRSLATSVTKTTKWRLKLAVAILRPVARILWVCLKSIHLFALLLGKSIMFLVFKSKKVIQWIKDYRAAKKDTREKGEDWSKRRYILGGLLQRRLEKRWARDEEEQRRSSSRGRSNTPRPASVEMDHGSEADGNGSPGRQTTPRSEENSHS